MVDDLVRYGKGGAIKLHGRALTFHPVDQFESCFKGIMLWLDFWSDGNILKVFQKY